MKIHRMSWAIDEDNCPLKRHFFDLPQDRMMVVPVNDNLPEWSRVAA
jgi:hypothetical protein